MFLRDRLFKSGRKIKFLTYLAFLVLNSLLIAIVYLDGPKVPYAL